MSLMLINPRKRRGSGRRKPRTAAQRAATRRMVAARAHNPVRKRRTRRHSARRSNPIGLARVHHTRRRHHARRRNPISMSGGNLGSMLMNGVKGAVGSVAVNAVTNFLPAVVKQGNVLYVTRAALALLLGTVGRKVAGNNARVMAEGALVVNFADLINSFAGGMLPGSQLHGVGAGYMGEYLSAMPQHLPYAGGQAPYMGEFMSEYERHLV